MLLVDVDVDAPWCPVGQCPSVSALTSFPGLDYQLSPRHCRLPHVTVRRTTADQTVTFCPDLAVSISIFQPLTDSECLESADKSSFVELLYPFILFMVMIPGTWDTIGMSTIPTEEIFVSFDYDVSQYGMFREITRKDLEKATCRSTVCLPRLWTGPRVADNSSIRNLSWCL